MLELTEWLAAANFPDRPWLLLGKGPTFDRHPTIDLGQFNLLALNHAAAELPVDVAHAVDIGVVEACGDRLADSCRWLLMPRYPHAHNEPADRLLEDYRTDVPALRRLDGEGRLIWYNLLGARPEGRSPVIGVRYFSSEAALNILGLLGARTVRSLGVDGGRSYGSAFRHLEDDTLLANGRPVFDLQFDQLATIAAEHGIDYRPLVQPLRIFIGTDDPRMVASRVLEYSIRKAASVPVEITSLLNIRTSPHGSAGDGSLVPSALSPLAVPGLCGYEGRALYLDAATLVFGDVAELADTSFAGHSVLHAGRSDERASDRPGPASDGGGDTALMLMDCDRLAWDIDELVRALEDGKYTHDRLVSQLCVVDPNEVAVAIAPEWNHIGRFEPGLTKLLNYAVDGNQPWRNDLNPLGEVWMAWYREAVEAGAVPPEEVEALIAAGHVKPSLAAALRMAPSRRAVLTDASLSLALAREKIASLETKLADVRSSWSYRTEWNLRRAVRGSTRLVRGWLGRAGGGGRSDGDSQRGVATDR